MLIEQLDATCHARFRPRSPTLRLSPSSSHNSGADSSYCPTHNRYAACGPLSNHPTSPPSPPAPTNLPISPPGHRLPFFIPEQKSRQACTAIQTTNTFLCLPRHLFFPGTARLWVAHLQPMWPASLSLPLSGTAHQCYYAASAAPRPIDATCQPLRSHWPNILA